MPAGGRSRTTASARGIGAYAMKLREIVRQAGSTVWRSGSKQEAKTSKTVRLLVEAIRSASAGSVSLGPEPSRVGPPASRSPELRTMPCWMALSSISRELARDDSGRLIRPSGAEVARAVADETAENGSIGWRRDQDAWGGGGQSERRSVRVCCDPFIAARSGIRLAASAWKVILDVPVISIASVA